MFLPDPGDCLGRVLRFQCYPVLVEDPVAEHRELNIAATSVQGDNSLVVSPSFGSFAIVVSPTGRVMQGRECREKQGPFQDLVTPARGVISADGSPGTPSDRCQPGIGTQMPGGLGVLARDLGEDP